MATGDFPDPAGMVWSDALGWHRSADVAAFGYAPRHPDFDEHWRLYPQYLRQPGQDVPNRLHGATINSEGDAI